MLLCPYCQSEATATFRVSAVGREKQSGGGFLSDTYHFCSLSLGDILVTRPCFLQGRLRNAILLGSHVHSYNSATFKEQGADVGRQLTVPATFLYLKSPHAPPRDRWSPNQVMCPQKSVQDACQTCTSWHSFLQHILEIFPPRNFLSREVAYLGENLRVDFSFYLPDFGGEPDDEIIPLQDLLT